MINNIFEFDNKTIEEIMTHRTEIVALPIDGNGEEIKSSINQKSIQGFPCIRIILIISSLFCV
jgi:putative hemolysin